MADDRLYEASQKEYWDYTSTLETAERKGEIKGLQQGVQQGVQQEKKKPFIVCRLWDCLLNKSLKVPTWR